LNIFIIIIVIIVILLSQGGVHHSLVLTKQGQMYTFGRGDSSQLGIKSIADEDSAGGYSDVPVEPFLPKDVKIVAITCGGNHNLALTSNNDVYTWGYGDMLALGHGFEKDEPLPKKLNFTKVL
jgi:regulator of chromosome condensation